MLRMAYGGRLGKTTAGPDSGRSGGVSSVNVTGNLNKYTTGRKTIQDRAVTGQTAPERAGTVQTAMWWLCRMA